MAVIRVENFGGEVPRKSARALTAPEAQTNQNLLATSAEFRPLQADTTVATAVASALSLYRLTRTSGGVLVSGDTTGWITETADKNYVKSQTNDDATERTVVSFNAGTSQPLVIDALGASRQLGVPAPTTKTLVTLNSTAQFTRDQAEQYVAGTLAPNIASRTLTALIDAENTSRLTNATTSVAGPYSLRGLTAATHPSSQRSMLEPWHLFATSTTAAATEAYLDRPALGGSAVSTTFYLPIMALPYWGYVGNLTTFQASLRQILHPTTGSQLLTEANITSLSTAIQAYFDPAGPDVKALRMSLDTAVQDFKLAVDYLLTSLPAVPTAPVKPTGPEYTYDGNGLPTRTAEWVTYDNALAAYNASLAAYNTAVANREMDKSARITTIARAQAEAPDLVARIEAVFAAKKRNVEAFITGLLNNLGTVNSTASPNGLFTVAPDRVIDTRFYVTTFVNDWGEESAPSPVSDALDVDQNDTVTVSRPTVPSGRNLSKWRIYRSNTSSTSSDFLFVDEALVSTPTFLDDKKAERLGEACPSFTWLEPPFRIDSQSAATIKPAKGADPYLRGCVGMPNGIVAGFIDNFVAFSESYMPYAWPVQYQITTEFPIVGLGVFGQTLFVGTRGNPYFISGSDAASMSPEKLDSAQSCVSRRSIVSGGNGVFYASPDGLCYASGAGVEVVTMGLFSREDWQALNPSSIVAAMFEGVYYFSYSGGAGGTYALDTIARKLTKVSFRATAMFIDPVTDGLFFTEGTSVKRAFSTGRRTGLWRTPVLTLPGQQGLAWVQVDGNQSVGTPVTVRWYGDGTLRHTATFTNTTPQRLPPGRWLEHEVEVESAARVTSVTLAGSIAELQQV